MTSVSCSCNLLPLFFFTFYKWIKQNQRRSWILNNLWVHNFLYLSSRVHKFRTTEEDHEFPCFFFHFLPLHNRFHHHSPEQDYEFSLPEFIIYRSKILRVTFPMVVYIVVILLASYSKYERGLLHQPWRASFLRSKTVEISQ